MGIPKYFRHITKKNPCLIVKCLNINLDNLYLDMNCLIHPCVKKIAKENSQLVKRHNKLITQDKYNSDLSFLTEFEMKSFKCIIDYIDKLIEFSNPSKLLYMAIDGVAPRGKMEQQRIRRFRSIKVSKMTNDIYKKYNVENSYFDSNCITPGTIFMKKLSNYLKSYMDKVNLDIDIILDDTGLIGEGEHKILQHIKKYTKHDINSVYGLDADLIMLSLVSGSKVYLLREAVHFGKVNMDELLYFDVEKFSDELFNEIKSIIDKKTEQLQSNDDVLSDTTSLEELEKQRIINDYICLCFFIGNDFLPSIIGLDINAGSINSLLDVYTDIFSIRRKYLVDETNSINFIFIRQLLTYFYSIEEDYLKKYQKRIDHFKPRINSTTKCERELEELNYYPIFNKNNLIKFGYDDWQNKYYKYYFNIGNSLKNSSLIHNICTNYIEGLQWNIKYYLEECPSYSWYYKYRNAPLLKDLVVYLIDRVYPKQFESKYYSPLEQLSLVLPYESSHLWAKSYKKRVLVDLKLAMNYPKEFELDNINKVYLHECDPILSDFDDTYLKTVYKDLQLTSLEKELNKMGELYVVSKNKISLKIE